MATQEMRQGASSAERVAKGLGWFSLGLGLTEIVAPRSVAHVLGVKDDERTCNTIRALGVREVGAGAGILSRPQPSPWLWARFAGDLIDLAFLGMAFNRKLEDRTLDRRESRAPIIVTESISVNKPREEVYRFWREFQNFPRFMQHLEAVTVHGSTSRWRATAPAGLAVEWDAVTTDDIENELIAWRSVAGAEVPNHGVVRFFDAPGDRGTEILIELGYSPPAGRLGATFARLFGEEPSQQIRSDLRRFKQVMEVGEVVLSDASIHRGPYPAQPSYEAKPRRTLQTERARQVTA